MSEPKSIETEGATVEEALASALEILQSRRDEVDVEVLANPSRGLLGLGGRVARVRVTRRPDGNGGAAALAGEEPLRPGDATPAMLESAKPILEDLIRRMGFTCGVRIEPGDEGQVLQISGEDSSILIGKHGQTLYALEYILNRLLSRDEEVVSRVHIDCEQYRVRRRRSLEQLAQRLSLEALRKRRPVQLEPMSPRDRRIVHLALQANPRVSTRSTGEGYFRRLEIIPEGDSRRSRPR
jgi:spoIIIJ-associated protein